MQHHCVAKTKTMVVSSRTLPSVTFCAMSSSLKRWGLLSSWGFSSMHQATSLISSLKAKATGSWAVVQRRHSQLQCGNTVNLQLQLLQSILVPSMHYGCELWGMHSPQAALANKARADLEQTYAKFLRRVCGVRSNTPSAMLLTELGLTSLKVFWWQQTLHFFNKIAASPPDSLFSKSFSMRSCLTITMMLFSEGSGILPGPFSIAWLVLAMT